MLKNFFLVAFREIRRNKIFALINVLGLSIGISAALVIFLIVQHEFSYEHFWKNKDRVYRVVSNMHFPDQDFKNSGVAGPLPDAMRKDFAGIEESSRFFLPGDTKVTIHPPTAREKSFRKQSHIIWADENYFKLFPYQWIAGKPEAALNAPNQVVLTASRARLYFPDQNPGETIGEMITYNDTVSAIVSGVVHDIDDVTDFTFQEFISMSTYANQLKKNGGDEWGSVTSSNQFFVMLKPGVHPKTINKLFPAFRKSHAKNDYLTTANFLQPLLDIHFNNDFDNFDQRLGHKPTMYGLLAVGAFLLILGCINFINLTTAQAAKRAKEIGIRKTMGSSRSHLVFQFLSETLVITVLATLFSIGLVPLILQIFSDFIPDGLHFNITQQPGIFIFILLLILVVSTCSGFYPAMVLSAYKPATVLKNVAHANTSISRRSLIRKTLTVSQFVIAQFFIVATIMVAKQIEFSLNKDLGFKKDAIIYFSTPFNFEKADNKQFILQQKLKGIPGIQNMSLAGAPPASNSIGIQTMKFIRDGKEIETSVEVKSADTNYVQLYHMKLVGGRNLQQSDTVREYLVNETYAKFLGFRNPVDIIGKTVEHGNGKLPIVGVVADIHTRSLHEPIKPLVLTSQAKYHSTFHIGLVPGNANHQWQGTIAAIEAAWKEVYPEEEFSYSFFDESIAKFYKEEQHTEKLLNWCALLSIVISCLGLLGLVIFTTNNRIKEIGVRKVLGATVVQIVSLISKDFLQLVLLAFLITAPLAWLAMHNWLQNFAYRTPISWWVFVVSGCLMFVIALFVLSIQIARAARLNPVKNLRTE